MWVITSFLTIAISVISCIPLLGAAILWGLIYALPQWLVLRGRVRRPELWLVVYLVTAVLVFLLLLVAFGAIEVRDWISQVLSAAITGYAMHMMLKHPGPRATWDLGWKPEKLSPPKQKKVRLPTPSKYKEEPQPSPEELLEKSRKERATLEG